MKAPSIFELKHASIYFSFVATYLSEISLNHLKSLQFLKITVQSVKLAVTQAAIVNLPQKHLKNIWLYKAVSLEVIWTNTF